MKRLGIMLTTTAMLGCLASASLAGDRADAPNAPALDVSPVLGITIGDLDKLTDEAILLEVGSADRMKEVKASADSGNTVAMEILAAAYRHGYFVEKSSDQACALEQKAADASPVAQVNYAACYMGKDNGRFADLLNKAEDSASKLGYLGYAKLNGIGFVKDAGDGLADLKASAKRGHVDAEAVLADYYLGAASSLEEQKEALNYANAAEAEHSSLASIDLAAMYINGTFVGQDKGQAFKYYTECADAIVYFPACLREKGSMLMQGIGTPADLKLGFSYLKRGADEGDSIAQNAVGMAYDHGNGVSKSDENAEKYYLASANAGYKIGEWDLGNFYHAHNRDKEAIPWLEKSGAQGYAEAYRELGMIYNNGKHGVRTDYQKAEYYDNKAIALGDERASIDLRITQENSGEAQNPSVPGFVQVMNAITEVGLAAKGQPVVPTMPTAPAATSRSEAGQRFPLLSADEERDGATARTYNQLCAGKTVEGTAIASCTQLQASILADVAAQKTTLASTDAPAKPNPPRAKAPPVAVAPPPPPPVVHHATFTHSYAWIPADDGSSLYKVTVVNTGDINLTCFIHITGLQWNVKSGGTTGAAPLQLTYNDVVTVRPAVGGSDSYEWGAMVPTPNYTIQCNGS